MSPNKKFSLFQAFALILGSVVIVLTASFLLLNTWTKKKEAAFHSNDYVIEKITQRGPVKEAIKSVYLTEMLELSQDNPQNLYTFDLNTAEQKLLSSGVIQKATLKKKFPKELEIDYEIRRPLAYLADYQNTLVDEQGVIFPQAPYFTPKILPKIYLGIEIEPFRYGKIVDKKMESALEVFNFLSQTQLGNRVNLAAIDVSHFTHESLGQREIVVTLYETIELEEYVRYLRLSTTNYKQELLHFLDLNAMSMPEHLVVDLRMFPNAYMTPLSSL